MVPNYSYTRNLKKKVHLGVFQAVRLKQKQTVNSTRESFDDVFGFERLLILTFGHLATSLQLIAKLNEVLTPVFCVFTFEYPPKQSLIKC